MERHNQMRKTQTSILLLAVLLGFSFSLPERGAQEIYHNGWIDLNKNGRMDVYEDPKAPIERRIDDLLSQMTLEEKTCQTATLYGVGRCRTGLEPPFKAELATAEWENRIWKHRIANIDEDLNGHDPHRKSNYAT